MAITLNHANLVVTDLKAAIGLFEKHFAFTCIETKGENVVAVLTNANDFTLVLMVSKEGDHKYPSAFHVGFMQPSEQAVTDFYQRLTEDGIDAGKEPRKIRDSFGFYFLFDNLMIEVGHYFVQ